MILRSIRLEDFGLYAGTTELDLVPRQTQSGASPIVLSGGKNGAGKTTLLEAVRLALYGRRAMGARVGQLEYDNYLRGRINRSSSRNEAAVALEFDYAEAGVVHRYSVRREWSAKGATVSETLLLEKDGAVIPSVPRDEWHHFLQELIPPGVSQLFFFDGEKISEIAEGEEDNEQLGEAVRGLLGIDLVSRLRVDLGLYLARHQRTEKNSVASRLEEISRSITDAEATAAEIADEVAGLVSQRDSQARAAEHIRRQFVAEGGDAATHSARTEAERDEVRRAITRAEHELRELSNRLLPIAMAPNLVGEFRAALARANGDSGGGLSKSLSLAFATWRAEGQPARSASWTSKHWADLDLFLAAQVSVPTQITTSPALREIGDGAATIARLAEVETITRPRARALLDELETLGHRARELSDALARADNAAAGVLLDDLRLAEQRVGATEARLKSRQEDLRLVRGQLVTLNRDQRRLLEEQAGSAKTAERLLLAARTAQALADYEQRLLDQKLAQLRGEFIGRFNYLARKSELIVDVKIDPVSFATTLVDRDGHDVPKAALSAGEKQIYAIAMLWALARTSGRPLPMIIDTPLARLDSDHRGNLVQRYFPEASHQVVLLSTDTEIDERMRRELGSNVSHTYRLEFDQESGTTSVLRGYFDGATEAEEVGRAVQQA
jgi:DNA sulfur modification protein DndD